MKDDWLPWNEILFEINVKHLFIRYIFFIDQAFHFANSTFKIIPAFYSFTFVQLMKSFGIVLLAIWITLGSFMPQNDMEELAKIPDLVSHFKAHRTKHNNDLSFWAFISEHYSTRDCEDKDHKQLPFFEHQVPGLIFVIPHFSLNLVQTFELIQPMHFPELQLDLKQISLSVWQPPRLS